MFRFFVPKVNIKAIPGAPPQNHPVALHLTLSEQDANKWLLAGVRLGRECKRRDYLVGLRQPLVILPERRFGAAARAMIPQRYEARSVQKDGDYCRHVKFQAPAEEAVVLLHPDAPSLVLVQVDVCLASSPKRATRSSRLVSVADRR